MFYGYVFNYPCFYGYPFGYPWISMDIHVLTCYGFSIQGYDRIACTTGLMKMGLSLDEVWEFCHEPIPISNASAVVCKFPRQTLSRLEYVSGAGEAARPSHRDASAGAKRCLGDRLSAAWTTAKRLMGVCLKRRAKRMEKLHLPALKDLNEADSL